MKIYVVSGEAGSYSDHTIWNVTAYIKKEDADNHARLATAYELWWMEEEKDRFDDEYANPYDPENIYHHYDSHSYYVWAIDVKDSFPEKPSENN